MRFSFMDKLSTMDQQTRPTQPTVPPGSAHGLREWRPLNGRLGLRGSESVRAGMGCGLGWTLASVCDAQRRRSVVRSTVALFYCILLYICTVSCCIPDSPLSQFFYVWCVAAEPAFCCK